MVIVFAIMMIFNITIEAKTSKTNCAIQGICMGPCLGSVEWGEWSNTTWCALISNISSPDYIFIQHDAQIKYLILGNLKPRVYILPKAGKLSSARSEHAVAGVRLETVVAFCQFDGKWIFCNVRQKFFMKWQGCLISKNTFVTLRYWILPHCSVQTKINYAPCNL